MTTQTNIPGLHHITVFASNPQNNVDFYTQVLGQRLVKTTINFDDPGTYHLYYADLIGTPGTVLTFFPWPHARRGQLGNGEVAAMAYSIAPDSLEYWQTRLAEQGVATSALETRFGETVLPFSDPDGLRIELITQTDAPALPHWENGPVPAEHALRGFHSITMWVWEAAASAQLLTHTFGYQHTGIEGNRHRYQSPDNAVGNVIDLVVRPEGRRGQMGAGTVHHIAFRARNDEEQQHWLQTIGDLGFGVTPVRDRQYFRSIYFREPSSVLFEIATDDPGFAIDEAVEDLGRNLKLPPWLESQRGLIEQKLPKLSVAEYDHA